MSNYDADIHAISSWERAEQSPDPDAHQHAHAYVCTACAWTGRGVAAYAHWRETRHAVRGKLWPPAWGVAVFSDGVSGR